MKPIDYVKAAGVAFALLVINVLIAILVVTIYAVVIDPGHPSEYYEIAALRIAPWCSHIAGTAFFFVAVFWLTTRRPDRRAFLFASLVTVLYAVIDAASIGFVGIWDLEFAVSMLAKYVAALVGAFVGTRRIATSNAAVTEPQQTG